MSNSFSSSAAASMQPLAAEGISIAIDDRERDTARPVPAASPETPKAPKQKISILKVPMVSATGHLSSTPAPARINTFLRNRVIIFVLIYVVYAFLHRKAWQLSAKLGATSEDLAQLFEFGQVDAQLDFHYITNQVTSDDAQHGQKQCGHNASSVQSTPDQRAIDTRAELLDVEEYDTQFVEQTDEKFDAITEGNYFKPADLVSLPDFGVLPSLLHNKLGYAGKLLQITLSAIHNLVDEYLCRVVKLPDGIFFRPTDLASLPDLGVLPFLGLIWDLVVFLCIQIHYLSLFFTRGLLLTVCLCLFWNKLRPSS